MGGLWQSGRVERINAPTPTSIACHSKIGWFRHGLLALAQLVYAAPECFVHLFELHRTCFVERDFALNYALGHFESIEVGDHLKHSQKIDID